MVVVGCVDGLGGGWQLWVVLMGGDACWWVVMVVGDGGDR